MESRSHRNLHHGFGRTIDHAERASPLEFSVFNKQKTNMVEVRVKSPQTGYLRNRRSSRGSSKGLSSSQLRYRETFTKRKISFTKNKSGAVNPIKYEDHKLPENTSKSSGQLIPLQQIHEHLKPRSRPLNSMKRSLIHSSIDRNEPRRVLSVGLNPQVGKIPCRYRIANL